MSIIVNHFSHHDFSESGIDHDLEVEEILNDIGFFANDDPLMGGEPEPGFPMSYIYPPTFLAPVSPDHQSDHDKMMSNVTITPSSSVQDIQTFSVPNPMAVLELVPSRPSSMALMPTISETPPKGTPNTKKAPKKDTTKGRKRKLADLKTVAVEAAPMPTLHPFPKMKDEGLTEEDLEERRQRNREHAKRSRQRKKSLTSTLEESVEDLKTENAKLREQLYAMIGPEKAQAMLEARRENGRAQFIQGLMQPCNRVMDEKTLSFLKNLRKNVTSDDDDSSKN
jgi:bZIP transcription factor